MFFHWDSVPAPDAPRGLCFLHVFAAATGMDKIDSFAYVIGFTCANTAFLHTSCSFLKVTGANHAILPPWMKVNPSVGILRLVVPLLAQIPTMCAAFAFSTYLLPQRGVQNRLFCLRHWIHVHKYGLSAHVRLFLSCHGGRSWIFVYVVGFTCANKAFLPPSSFIDIVPKCGPNCDPNCGKSPLSSGGFAIRRWLCRCSARRIAR